MARPFRPAGGGPQRLTGRATHVTPKVCPLCESRDVQVVAVEPDRAIAVCKTCFARFEVIPYRPPIRED